MFLIFREKAEKRKASVGDNHQQNDNTRTHTQSTRDKFFFNDVQSQKLDANYETSSLFLSRYNLFSGF